MARAQLVVDGEISIPRSFTFEELRQIPEQVSERARPVTDLENCVLVYAVGELPLWDALGGPVRLFAAGGGRCANVKNVVSLSFAVEAARIERACAHEHDRVARGSTRAARD